MRINPHDCDVPLPDTDCMLGSFVDSTANWTDFLPSDLAAVGPVWVTLVGSTIALGDVLSSVYRPGKTQLKQSDLEVLESRIRGEVPTMQPPISGNGVSSFFASYAKLHIE